MLYSPRMAYANISDQREASKRHYIANKASYLQRNKKYRAHIQAFVRQLKESNPCRDCGVFYPYYVMDFDHVETNAQDINLLSSTGRIGALKNEIKKCELVCANCHRTRTHQRSLKSEN